MPDSPSEQWKPIPDPTVLTTEALLREIGNLYSLLTTRLDSIEEANKLRLHALTEGLQRVPSDTARLIKHHEDVAEQRFANVETQFRERDVRVESDKKASKEALDAALLAAKELVGVTNDNTGKQVDQISAASTAQYAAIDARITELKERIDRGQSGFEGAQTQRTETRSTGQLVAAAVGAFLVAVSLAVSISALMMGR